MRLAGITMLLLWFVLRPRAMVHGWLWLVAGLGRVTSWTTTRYVSHYYALSIFGFLAVLARKWPYLSVVTPREPLVVGVEERAGRNNWREERYGGIIISSTSNHHQPPTNGIVLSRLSLSTLAAATTLHTTCPTQIVSLYLPCASHESFECCSALCGLVSGWHKRICDNDADASTRSTTDADAPTTTLSSL